MGLVAAVAASLAGAAVAIAGSPPAYRLGTAVTASVTEPLVLGGTIEPAREVAVGFPTAGTVASVPASVGEHVSAGQPLAALVTTKLATAEARAADAVAQAQLRLVDDEARQAAAAAAAAAEASATGSSPAAIQADQSRVATAQHQVAADLSRAKAEVRAATIACVRTSPPASPATSGPARAKGTGAGTGAGAGPSRAGGPAGGSTSSGACVKALSAALAAESAGAGAQRSLSGAQSTLNRTMAQARAAARSSGPAVIAATIAADRATIDTAEVGLAQARAALAAATLRSPVAGTVVAVPFAAGEHIGTSAAAADKVMVVGAGSQVALAAVSDTEVGAVHPGEVASVAPDASSGAFGGVVESVGMLATTASNGTVTYPVTVSITGTSHLPIGSVAQVTITVAHAGSGVAVPTSAVRTRGSHDAVELWSGGQVRLTPVTVGVVGPILTQVTSGLRPGQRVVLARLDAPLPNSTTTLRQLRRAGSVARLGGRAGAGRPAK